MSYADVALAADEIANGLAALGMQAGDRVAILASTRAEWTLAAASARCGRAPPWCPSTTRTPPRSASTCSPTPARASSSARTPRNSRRSTVSRAAAPKLEHRDRPHGIGARRHDARRSCVSADARSQGAGRDPRTAALRSRRRGHDRLHLRHDRAAEGLHAHAREHAGHDRPLPRTAWSWDDEMVAYLFLPLAHVLARVTQMVALSVGGTHRLLARRPQADRRPSWPRPARRTSPRSRASSRRSTRPSWATWRSRDGLSAPSSPGRWPRAAGRGPAGAGRQGLRRARAQAPRARRSPRPVQGPWHLRREPVPRAHRRRPDRPAEIIEFFDACGVLVLEGYGLTETCAASTLNTVCEQRIGTVGRPLPHDAGARRGGRRAVRGAGPTCSPVYYRNEQATSESLIDGWLHTGDLGSVDERRVRPASPAARRSSSSPRAARTSRRPTSRSSCARRSWISQAVVFGDNKPYLVALLTLDRRRGGQAGRAPGHRPR